MGIIVSRPKSSNGSFGGIRVAHLSGLVEEFDKPVKAKDLTAQNPRHFVCSCRSLQAIKPCPLPAEEQLQLGELYFLLPFAALEGELSPSNLMSLTSRLIAAAKKGNAAKLTSTKKQRTANAAISRDDLETMLARSRPTVNAGDYNAQGRYLGMGKGNTGDCPELQMAYRQHVLSRSKAWRPRLHTIEETCLTY